MSKAARAANSQTCQTVTLDRSGPLPVSAYSSTVIVSAPTAVTISGIDSPWHRGRRLLIKAAGTSKNITIDAGPGLTLIGLAVVLGPHDALELMADHDASGSPGWVQIRARVNL